MCLFIADPVNWTDLLDYDYNRLPSNLNLDCNFFSYYGRGYQFF